MPLLVTALDLQAGALTVRHGKGDKRRTIPLPKQTVETLRQWLTQQRAWLKPGWSSAPVTEASRDERRVRRSDSQIADALLEKTAY